MEPGFLAFVWRRSWRSQLMILGLAVATFPFVYLSLELPKIIINDAIQGEDGPRGLFHWTLDRIPFLLTLCGFLLVAVGIVNTLKWLMNVAIGRTGAEMLSQLRRRLFGTVLRYPPKRLQRTNSGELVQSIMGEIEPLGGFIGETIATPVFQSGLMIVYAGFIFAQDWMLGLAAIALFPLQGWLIPRLQMRVVRLNRTRAVTARGLADFIGESMEHMDGIRVDGRAAWRIGLLSNRLKKLSEIRLAIFRRKYAVKAINNLLNQAPPLVFYSVGGWLVIEGRLDFGALVAVLAAHKEMAAPWRALLGFVQNWQEYSARYRFVVENFTGGDLAPPERVYGPAAAPLSGALCFEIIDSGSSGSGLHAPRFEAPAGAMVAVTGGANGARDALLRFCAALDAPTDGHVALGGRELVEASFPEIGAAIGYAPADPDIFDGPVIENLGAVDAAAAPASTAGRRRELAIAAGLAPELSALALVSPAPTTPRDAWTALARRGRAALDDGEGAALRENFVEPWREDAFNPHASLAENVVFAAPDSPLSGGDALAQRPEIRRVLQAVAAAPLFAQIGADIAAEFAGLVSAVGAASRALDGLPGYSRETILAAAEAETARSSPFRAKRRHLLHRMLAARFVPARDKLDVVDDARIAALLALRKRARSRLSGLRGYQPFSGDGVNPGLTLLENILRGARRFDRRGAERAVVTAVEQILVEAGDGDQLLDLGLGANAGRDGGRLTLAGRRRAGLVRAIAKAPKLLILAETVDRQSRALARAEAPDAVILAAMDEPCPCADIRLHIDENGLATVVDALQQGEAG